MIQQHDFDVVLMDVQMPIMDGYEATRLIRAMDDFRGLPIIAMTANVMQSDIERTRAAGMNGHLGKPINVDELLATLAKQLNLSTEVVLGDVNDVVNAVEMNAPLDISQGIQTCGNNDLLYRRLLHRFLTEQVHAATELNHLLKQQDWSAAERFAHSMKGMAANIGANSLSQFSAEMEHALAQKKSLTEQAVQQWQVHLDATLLAIQQYLANTETDEAASPVAMDIESFVLLFQQLEAAVQDDDTSAIGLIETLAQQLGGHELPELSTLKKAIEQFDFEQAQETLPITKTALMAWLEADDDKK